MNAAAASSTFVAADGDGYEQVMGRWSRRLAQPFLDFAGSADGERVLDVGCGTGHLAAAVAARSPASEVLGIDLAPEYIAHARHHQRGARLAFELGDACALPGPDAAFDRVLSLLLLHFVPEPARAVAEMRRGATGQHGRGGGVGRARRLRGQPRSQAALAWAVKGRR